MGVTPGWGGGGRLINIIGKTKSLRILGASELLTGQRAYDIGYADIIAENGETLSKSKEFLDPYIYFSSRNEGELDIERKRNSVKAVSNLFYFIINLRNLIKFKFFLKKVRGMKAIIAKANDSGIQRNYMRFENALFNNLWGQEENLAAILNPKSKNNKIIK